MARFAPTKTQLQSSSSTVALTSANGSLGRLPAFGAGHHRVYFEGGAFVVPDGVTQLRLRVLGPGGPGGYTAHNTAVVCKGGGGGGGGGFALKVVDVAPGDSIPVVVGDTALPGSQSGTSSFGIHVSATGGHPGTYGTTTVAGQGGNGGEGIGGDVNHTGGKGGDGAVNADGSSLPPGCGGGGAPGSQLGDGGNGGDGSTDASGGGGAPGGNATRWGASAFGPPSENRAGPDQFGGTDIDAAATQRGRFPGEVFFGAGDITQSSANQAIKLGDGAAASGFSYDQSGRPAASGDFAGGAGSAPRLGNSTEAPPKAGLGGGSAGEPGRTSWNGTPNSGDLPGGRGMIVVEW